MSTLRYSLSSGLTLSVSFSASEEKILAYSKGQSFFRQVKEMNRIGWRNQGEDLSSLSYYLRDSPGEPPGAISLSYICWNYLSGRKKRTTPSPSKKRNWKGFSQASFPHNRGRSKNFLSHSFSGSSQRSFRTFDIDIHK